MHTKEYLGQSSKGWGLGHKKVLLVDVRAWYKTIGRQGCLVSQKKPRRLMWCCKKLISSLAYYGSAKFGEAVAADCDLLSAHGSREVVCWGVSVVTCVTRCWLTEFLVLRNRLLDLVLACLRSFGRAAMVYVVESE
jgi:hypothetical protein